MRSSSSWKTKIDLDKKTGMFGHSMGGASSIAAAGDSSSVSKANIGAAIALMPWKQSGPRSPKVPTLYIAGSKDTLVSPAHVKSHYNACPKSYARGYMEFRGNTHMEPTGKGSNKEIKWILSWFGCYLHHHKSS